MTDVPRNENDLREMVYHTDARVSAIESQVSAIGTGQLRIEQKFDTFLSQANAPKHVNYAAWIGLVFSGALMLVGGTVAMANYFSILQAPVITDVNQNATKVANLVSFQREAHHEFGILMQSDIEKEGQINRLWNHVHKQEDVDTELRERLAKLEAYNEKLEEFVKSIDSLGSRKWIRDGQMEAR